MKKYRFGSTPVFLVSEHHQVLRPWCGSASPEPFTVLTLDHHTDVLPSFHHSGATGPFGAEHVDEALSLLRHDEHFDWALRSGILSHAAIISQENFTVSAHPSLQVICDSRWPAGPDVWDSKASAYPVLDACIESDFLERQLECLDFKLEHYIFDLDLDYFLTDRSATPRDGRLFYELVRNAEFVTCSLESDWQRILRLKGETFSSSDIFGKLFPSLVELE